ncbi:MAG: zinc metallopeptidase [Bacteroidetes bacterium]|uniref:Zinc metallopeptidase n=1 Tax=Phaeocystidibacter marisrubri TaxID=1577780 RepID=A0A6L3ZJM4_9FLAO|nr:zinc metallopeptidase [Phaeocystidibacter marisrubri]KAB2818144.1 zinc metallopeptidase [Phaeocystidibacter marisrubri]TNE29100.1 MAG: zinc metallopeptidase [Bacteroidota bacterium]
MIWIIVIGFMIIGFVVQGRLKSKMEKYSKVPVDAGLTGREVAEKMLHDSGIHDVKVISVPGKLTDHYNPANKTVNLSPDVFNGRSIAAASIAAHECGHAIQHATGYAWLNMRTAMVPAVQFSSKLMNIIFWMAIFGMFVFSWNYELVMWIFIGAQAVVTLFSVVTLPVEYDATNRALAWLENANITSPATHEMAVDGLKWAARTYLVSALAAITVLLYYVMSMLGND